MSVAIPKPEYKTLYIACPDGNMVFSATQLAASAWIKGTVLEETSLNQNLKDAIIEVMWEKRIVSHIIPLIREGIVFNPKVTNYADKDIINIELMSMIGHLAGNNAHWLNLARCLRFTAMNEFGFVLGGMNIFGPHVSPYNESISQNKQIETENFLKDILSHSPEYLEWQKTETPVGFTIEPINAQPMTITINVNYSTKSESGPIRNSIFSYKLTYSKDGNHILTKLK